MFEHLLTIGLFDKETKKQEIPTSAAKEFIKKTLIENFNIYAFTMIDCDGVYRMNETGDIVQEPSVRLEIAAEASDVTKETIYRIVAELKAGLNQESIMYKVTESNIDFI